MSLSATSIDVISDLANVRPGSAVAELRAQRPEAVAHAQGSYAALFDPTEFGGLTRTERLATAVRVVAT